MPSRSAIIRAIIVSLLIGTILLLINQYETLKQCLRTGVFPLDMQLKIFLDYFVPFAVSLYSSWQADRAHKKGR